MTLKTLFSDGDLRMHLAEKYHEPDKVLRNVDPDKFLQMAESDLNTYLISFGTVSEIGLDRKNQHMLDGPEEMTREIVSLARGWTKPRNIARWTVVVPILGEPRLLTLRASTWSSNPPQANIVGYDLHVYYDATGTVSVEQLEAYFDQSLNAIEKSVEWSNLDIGQHNRALSQRVPAMASARRAELLQNKQVQASIKYPIRRRSDASDYAIPISRRIITPQRPREPNPTGSRFEPEPVIDEADYDAALEVLRNGRNALERSPSTAQKLNEEDIRNLLLVLLNGQFKGQAGGELFNGAGKTDILIRSTKDTNVFIGECKFWTGPKKFSAAIDQLLGYMTWRDTKAALLIFIKGSDPTAIKAKATRAIEVHPNFKRLGKNMTEDRYDFVLHANGDRSRELMLALMLFVIPQPE